MELLFGNINNMFFKWRISMCKHPFMVDTKNISLQAIEKVTIFYQIYFPGYLYFTLPSPYFVIPTDK